MLLDDPEWVGQLATWGRALGKPRAILVISAHWEQAPVTLGATSPQPPIYDFSGFPEKFYRLQYRAPGAPELASHVRALLDGAAIAYRDEPTRGHDHGVYVPLMCMYPQADVPILQLSLPTEDARQLFALGRALAPLAGADVAIVGTGFLVHNLRALSAKSPPSWAVEFDAWCADVLVRRDVDALIDYRARAPGVREALPTHEHFLPVVVAAGAADGAGLTTTTFPITGFWMNGAMTKRSVQFER
jgi:4,5-DOPA dioxygenase extradiol